MILQTISGTLGPVTDHLWQSTIFALAAALLTLAFRSNRAQVRYWLWLSASIKFLVPFALLMSFGSSLWDGLASRNIATEFVAPAVSLTVVQITQPFSDTISFVSAAPHPTDWIHIAIFAVWACGFATIALMRLRGWVRIRAVVRASTPIDIAAAVVVRSSPSLLEPGVLGFLHPTLLLPEGILQSLTPPQFEAVLAHEMSHVRRRDNLTAAIHMLVEAIFWFHPLAWWIGARLVEERERACDEAVLRLGTQPDHYAHAILNVCKLYVESTLTCISGVTGADVNKRIHAILTDRVADQMNLAKKLWLGAFGIAALSAPIIAGMVSAPSLRAQIPAEPLTFAVASVKQNTSNVRGGGLDTEQERLTGTNVTLRTYIRAAYHLQNYQLSGGPGWIESDRYDMIGKADHPVGDDELMLMLQALLVDRFKLALRRETKETSGYALLVGKNGSKLHEVEAEGKGWIRNGLDNISGQEVSMTEFAADLSGRLSVPVVDLTGIKGVFDLKLQWTPDASQSRGPGENKEVPSTDVAADSSGPSVFTALQEQLGLRLESRKVQAETFLVDHVERPSEN
jgi:bla regulator protein blaR1